MATPPDPRIYLADDWSWAITGGAPATAWQNLYIWDGHGALGKAGYGAGAGRGYSFFGEGSSGTFGWTIVNLDTGASLASATMATCFGHNMGGTATGVTDPIVEFKEAVGGVRHVWLNTNASGGNNYVRVYNGDGTLLGTSDGVNGGTGMPAYMLPAGAPDKSGPTTHLEIKVVVHSSTGTVQVWADDIQIFDLVNKNTRNGGTGVIGHINLWASGTRGMCEWFVHDGSARLTSEFRVGYVPVATDGTYSDGTAVGAATFLQAVDDTPAVPELEITTYGVLDATGTPKKTSFQSGSFPDTWLQIRDIHPQIVVEKSDGGTNTGKTGLKSGATEVYTTSAYAVPDAWVVRRLALRTDPAAGTPLWTRITGMASEVIVDRES